MQAAATSSDFPSAGAPPKLQHSDKNLMIRIHSQVAHEAKQGFRVKGVGCRVAEFGMYLRFYGSFGLGGCRDFGWRMFFSVAG